MTKMATMPIRGKNPLKVFCSKISKAITIALRVQHLGQRTYNVCSNDDPGLTLTYFTSRSILLSNRCWNKCFIETIEVFGLKFGKNACLCEYMNTYTRHKKKRRYRIFHFNVAFLKKKNDEIMSWKLETELIENASFKVSMFANLITFCLLRAFTTAVLHY